MSRKHKKRRWWIKLHGKGYYVRQNFLSQGLARAFLRSIGLDDTKKFEFEKK